MKAFLKTRISCEQNVKQNIQDKCCLASQNTDELNFRVDTTSVTTQEIFRIWTRHILLKTQSEVCDIRHEKQWKCFRLFQMVNIDPDMNDYQSCALHPQQLVHCHHHTRHLRLGDWSVSIQIIQSEDLLIDFQQIFWRHMPKSHSMIMIH